jgi:hypothetical protein
MRELRKLQRNKPEAYSYTAKLQCWIAMQIIKYWSVEEAVRVIAPGNHRYRQNVTKVMNDRGVWYYVRELIEYYMDVVDIDKQKIVGDVNEIVNLLKDKLRDAQGNDLVAICNKLKSFIVLESDWAGMSPKEASGVEYFQGYRNLPPVRSKLALKAAEQINEVEEF